MALRIRPGGPFRVASLVAQPNPLPIRGDGADGIPPRRRAPSWDDDLAPNLLLTTLMLAAMASAALCRGPLEAQTRHRPPPLDPAPQNWILAQAAQAQASPFAPVDLAVQPRRVRSADFLAPNLLTSVFGLPANAAPLPFLPVDTSSPARRVAAASDLHGSLLQTTLAPAGAAGAPFAPVDLNQPARRARFDNVADPNLVLTLPYSTTPVCRGALEQIIRRRPITNGDGAQNWLLLQTSGPQAAPFVPVDLPIRAPRRWLGPDHGGQSLLTSTFSLPGSAAPLPFAPVDLAQRARRPIRTDEPLQALLTSTFAGQGAATPAPFSPVDYARSRPRRALAFELDAANLLIFAPPDIGLTTPDSFEQRARRRLRTDETFGNPIAGPLGLAPPVVLPFPSGEWPIRPAKRFAQADGWPNPTLTTLSLPPLLVLPFAQGEYWPTPKIRRWAQADGWPNITLQTLALLPTLVLPVPSGEWPIRPAKRFAQADGWPNVTLTTLALPKSAPFVPVDFTQTARHRLLAIDTQGSLLVGTLGLPPVVVVTMGGYLTRAVNADRLTRPDSPNRTERMTRTTRTTTGEQE